MYEITTYCVPTTWSNQVAKLLNHSADNDWILLGKCLGYSTTELGYWASQVNPSMALLNDWFMTHNEQEATYGLVKILENIDRQDVIKIIREESSSFIYANPDVLQVDIKRLPSIFLSYCEDKNQEFVSNLKHCLKKAGYESWMKNDESIHVKTSISRNRAIRGAKVLICCLDTCYIQSEECLHELRLIVNTGKPLIIFHIEDKPWPPDSAFDRIIRRHAHNSIYTNESDINNDFVADKFVQLLGHIRYYVAPDPAMISEHYLHWFVPQIDSLIFLQSKSNGGKNFKYILKDDIPLVVSKIQIVISYEWDSQTDAIILYKRLTQLGYRCWLDIFQMDGGGSLWNKISAVIRNSECMIACITTKYTKSINGQREMALADMFSKPIIPLLLKHLNRWPPIGPMSLTLGGTSDLNFYSSSKNLAIALNNKWSDDEFKKVVSRLNEIIPLETRMFRRCTIDMNQPIKPNRYINHIKESIRLRSAPTTTNSRLCSIM